MNLLYDELRHNVEKHCFEYLYRGGAGDSVCLQCFRWLITSCPLLTARSTGTRQLTDLLLSDRAGLSKCICQQHGPYLAQTLSHAISSDPDEDLLEDLLSLASVFTSASPHQLPALVLDRVVPAVKALFSRGKGNVSGLGLRGLLKLFGHALTSGFVDNNRPELLHDSNLLTYLSQILCESDDCEAVCEAIRLRQQNTSF
eukprot:jgi/Botrbrau1/4858/Bobra.0032s0016.1